MKLLFITSRLPWPPDRGDRLRTYNLLRVLSRDHKITLVSFYTQNNELFHAENLQKYCEVIHLIHLPVWKSLLSVLTNFWRGIPWQAAYYKSKPMKELVDDLTKEDVFSTVYIHLFRMAPYLADKQDLYRIVDLTDAISLEILLSLPYRTFFSKLIYQFEQPRIASFECEVAGWADEIWLISDRDRQFLGLKCINGNFITIPNGINPDLFFPKEQTVQDNRLIFVGNFDVAHNIDAINFLAFKIFPLVRSECPDCKLVIAGAGKGKKLSAISQIPGVVVKGYVENLNDELNEAKLFVAPLRFSAGVQNKVLEAMMAGVPVVTTSPVGAGLGAFAGREIVVGSTASEIANKIIDLLGDEILRQNLSLRGREFILNKFSWQSAVQRLKSIEEVVNG